MKISHISDTNTLRTLALTIFMAGFGWIAQGAIPSTTYTRAVFPMDSIGVEAVNNKEVILHRLEPKETYYGLGRRYGVAVSELIQFNNNKPLKIGEIVRIPTNRPVVSASQLATQQAEEERLAAQEAEEQAPQVPHVQLLEGQYTDYIIGRGETLYTVSSRFGVSVESIRLANGLADDRIKVGQVLQVPKKELPPSLTREPEPTISASAIVDTTMRDQEEFHLQPNRYGIREVNEKGTGVWISDLSQDGASMLALHNTAPVGTVMKVTNPMTNLSTFVKVVGKFVETAETQGALIVISNSVASIIGILDRRFQIEIAYGAPVEESPR